MSNIYKIDFTYEGFDKSDSRKRKTIINNTEGRNSEKRTIQKSKQYKECWKAIKQSEYISWFNKTAKERALKVVEWGKGDGNKISK